MDPATIQSAFLGVILIILFLVILPGILQVIGGVGVWKRWNWARMLLIVLGGLDAFLALPNLVGGNLIGFVLSGGWGVFALYVLLSDPYRREFLSGPEQ